MNEKAHEPVPSVTKPVVGIDASRTTSDTPTGTEGYSYHLIRALLPHLAARYRTRLYFREPPDATAFPGAEMRVIPFPRLWTHVRLSWEMRQQPPDLLFVPAHVLPLVRPVKTLVTVHDLGYRYFPGAHPWRQRLYLDWSTRWNVRAATHILADSQATRDAIVREYGVAEDKITVAYPGYDSDLTPVRDPQTLAGVQARYGISAPYILFLSRIQPRKNVLRLVNAFAHILPHHPNMTLVLAGPTGWLADPVVARVRALGLEKRVILPGYIAASDKAALISGAAVFAYPSLYEGFGFPVLEAQACEVPLLASTTSSLPEVVGDGGLLVDPLDEDAIVEGLRRLLADEDMRRVLVIRGKANVQRFSWAQTARTVTNVIDQILLSG